MHSVPGDAVSGLSPFHRHVIPIKVLVMALALLSLTAVGMAGCQ